MQLQLTLLLVVCLLFCGVRADAGLRVILTENFFQNLRGYFPFIIDPFLSQLVLPLQSQYVEGTHFQVNITNITVANLAMLPLFNLEYTNRSSMIITAPYRSSSLTFAIVWKNDSSTGVFQGSGSFRNMNEMELQLTSNEGKFQVDILTFKNSLFTMNTGDLSPLSIDIQNATLSFFNNETKFADALHGAMQFVVNEITTSMNGTITIPLPKLPINITIDYRLTQNPQIIPKDRMILDFNGYFSVSGKACSGEGLPPVSNSSYGAEIFISKGRLDCLVDDIKGLPFKDIISTFLDGRMSLDVLFRELLMSFVPGSGPYLGLILTSSLELPFWSGPQNELLLRLHHFGSISVQAGLNLTLPDQPELVLNAQFLQANLSASDFANAAPRYQAQLSDQGSMNSFVNTMMLPFKIHFPYPIDPNLWASAQNALDVNSIGFDTTPNYLKIRLNSKSPQ